ncbi:MAG: LamG-like jellyroll fold domain-containing protein [Anaerohalosphaeraceae bacterium]
MRVMSLLLLSSNLIGLSAAYVCLPFDGCTWGFSPNALSIEPGFVLTDAVLTLTNVRPVNNCLNPLLSVRLLENPAQGFLVQTDQSQPSQTCLPNAPALTAAWRMNEYTGTQANNSFAGGSPAIFINNPVWVEGEGVSFSGSQYLQIDDSVNLCSRMNLAVSLWFKIRSPRPYGKLFIKPYETRSDPWELAALDLGADGLTPRFLLSDGIPGGQDAVASAETHKILLNQWYHLLGTFDGSRIQLWLNGSCIAQSPADLTIGTNSMPICIGGRLGLDTIDGIIRDVRIYSGLPTNQPLIWLSPSDFFSPHGTLLKTFDASDIKTNRQTLSFSLQQIDSPDSWVYTIYPRPFALGAPLRTIPVPFSSAMLELLDTAGRTENWGIGIDADGFYFDTLTLVLTIEPLDGSQAPTYQTFTYRNIRAPLILAPTLITAEPRQPILFTLTVLELDGNPYTVSVQNLPAGAVFDNGTFRWTPADNQLGDWAVVFTATDGVMSSQRAVVIKIKEPTPIFTPLENQTVYELQTLTLPVQAVNLAGQPVPITANNLPVGAVFDGNVLEWKPAYGQAGTYTVSFTASNEIRQETITVTLTVLPYKPPAKPKTILIL